MIDDNNVHEHTDFLNKINGELCDEITKIMIKFTKKYENKISEKQVALNLQLAIVNVTCTLLNNTIF